MEAKGCGSVFPTIKTVSERSDRCHPELYNNYTLSKVENQQRNSNRCLETSFAGVSTYSDWLVTAAAETELAPTDIIVGIH